MFLRLIARLAVWTFGPGFVAIYKNANTGSISTFLSRRRFKRNKFRIVRRSGGRIARAAETLTRYLFKH
jgi:hypothetical protein